MMAPERRKFMVGDYVQLQGRRAADNPEWWWRITAITELGLECQRWSRNEVVDWRHGVAESNITAHRAGS